jgi:hypothetical protein
LPLGSIWKVLARNRDMDVLFKRAEVRREGYSIWKCLIVETKF